MPSESVMTSLTRGPNRPTHMVSVILKQIFNYVSVVSGVFSVLDLKVPSAWHLMHDLMEASDNVFVAISIAVVD